MDDFVEYTNQVRTDLPYGPRAQIARIRNAVPDPTAETVMQKIIPASDLERYMSGKYDNIQGFLTKASDTKNLKSYDDLYYGLRLDYADTKFFLEDGCCYAIRFSSKLVPSKVAIARGQDIKYPYPFTSTGFTAGTNGRVGVPEFKVLKETSEDGIPFNEGTEIWKITRDGEQTLYAIYDKNKLFKIVEQ